jgi:hypothetical protein
LKNGLFSIQTLSERLSIMYEKSRK